MTTHDVPRPLDGPPVTAGEPNRWKALAVLGLFQFMLVLDLTVVNVALPRVQHDLGFSPTGLAWVVNGYVLMAAGFLLLGGRIADVFGRRRIFLLGVTVFAVASLVSGAATNPAMLIFGRFAQGLGQALAAPAALGMVVLLFQDPHERITALGIWAGLSGLGGVAGSVISGVLTGLASWRYIFFVNVPVALVVIVLVPIIVKKSGATRNIGRLGFTGPVIGTAGLVAVVYGLLQAATSAWGSWQVLIPLVGGIVLIAAMVIIEARSADPLIPLRFFADRVRAVTYGATLFNTAAFFTYVFLLTLFEQKVLGYTPLQGGLSYLPLGLGIGAGLAASTALMPRLGYRTLLGGGLLGVAVGLYLSSGITPHSSYVGGILPGMIVLAIFSGVCMPAATNAAFHGVTRQDSSLASAVQNTMMQIGGAVGLAGLVTVAVRYAQQQVAEGIGHSTAVTSAYGHAFQTAAILLAIIGVTCLTAMGPTATPPPIPRHTDAQKGR